MGSITAELRSCVKVGGGRPGLPVPNSPYGLCGRNIELKLVDATLLYKKVNPFFFSFFFFFYSENKQMHI